MAKLFFCLRNVFRTHCSFIMYVLVIVFDDCVIIPVTSIKRNVMIHDRRTLFAVCSLHVASSYYCEIRKLAFLCVFFKMTDLSDMCALQLVCQSVCLSVAFGYLSLEYGNSSLFIAIRMKSMQLATWQRTAQVAQRRNNQFCRDS